MPYGHGSKPMVPFQDRCTTHFRTYFSGDWDVHWGYGVLTHGHMGLSQKGTLTFGGWRSDLNGLPQSHAQVKSLGFLHFCAGGVSVKILGSSITHPEA